MAALAAFVTTAWYVNLSSLRIDQPVADTAYRLNYLEDGANRAYSVASH